MSNFNRTHLIMKALSDGEEHLVPEDLVADIKREGLILHRQCQVKEEASTQVLDVELVATVDKTHGWVLFCYRRAGLAYVRRPWSYGLIE